MSSILPVPSRRSSRRPDLPGRSIKLFGNSHCANKKRMTQMSIELPYKEGRRSNDSYKISGRSATDRQARRTKRRLSMSLDGENKHTGDISRLDTCFGLCYTDSVRCALCCTEYHLRCAPRSISWPDESRLGWALLSPRLISYISAICPCRFARVPHGMGIEKREASRGTEDLPEWMLAVRSSFQRTRRFLVYLTFVLVSWFGPGTYRSPPVVLCGTKYPHPSCHCRVDFWCWWVSRDRFRRWDREGSCDAI